MQWAFLAAGLAAALAEMHTGTFYLAGVAAAALISYTLGFWITGTPLVVAFVALCAGVTVLIMITRKRRHGKDLVDFDIGQMVSVDTVVQPGNRVTVRYRGAQWDAVMDDGSAPAPGDNAVIKRKTDKLLHLVARP